MKYIIFLIDGAADYQVKELGMRTPLMVAKKPNIDLLTKKGKCGLFKTIPDNFSTGSAVANLSVLGYDPVIHFHGRAVLEAASMGVKLDKDDLALRCNTLCVKNNKIKNHSAGHITDKESHELIRAIDQQLGNDKIKFYPGVSYRHLLVLKGNYSEDVECMPPHDHVGEKVSDLLVKTKSINGEKTAAILNKLMLDSQKIMEKHTVNIERVKKGKDPANMVWLWSPGKKPDMKTFQELYKIKGASISAVDLIKGLGIYAGMDAIDVEGATGLHDTNYEGKADACIEALKDHDLVYVHIEGIDEASHDGDLKLKIKCIEDFDKRLLGRVLENIKSIKDKVRIAILPDHPTPVEEGIHVSDSVPFTIYDKKERPDTVQSFDELNCSKGDFGLLERDGFIKALLKK